MNVINQLFDKVYVVNLASSKDRMKHMSDTLKSENISFTRFNAVYGKHLSKDDVDRVTTRFCKLFCSKSMIGCALSHIGVWKDAEKRGLDSVLVLEDDVEFMPHYQEHLAQAMKQLPHDWDFLYLGCNGLCDKTRSKSIIHYLYKLVTNQSNPKTIDMPNVFIPEAPTTTIAYAISKSGYTKLLDVIKKINYHIDFQIASNHPHLNIYAVHPKCVRPKNLPSTISDQSFPVIPNHILSHFKDKDGIDYSWYMNLLILEILGIPFNVWSVVLLILGYVSVNRSSVRYFVIVMLLLELPFIDRSYAFGLIYLALGSAAASVIGGR